MRRKTARIGAALAAVRNSIFRDLIVPGLIIGIVFPIPVAPAAESGAATSSPPPDGTVVSGREPVSDFQARRELARALSYREETLEEAIAEYEILLRERPGDAEVMAELARVLVWKGEYPRAADLYRSVLSSVPLPAAETHVGLGDAYLYSGKREEAIAAYREALALDPGLTKAKKQLALALSWSGRPGEAFPLLVELNRLFPDDREITVELARLHGGRGEHEKAAALISGLLAADPGDAELLIEAAEAAGAAGRAARSRRLYLEALTIRPDDDWKLRFADSMTGWGDFYRAEKIFRDYLEKRPGSIPVALKLAGVLSGGQRYEEARGIYRELLARDPGLRGALTGLATAYLREKDFPNALAVADDLLGRDPLHPEGLMLRGAALIRLGRTGRAIDDFETLGEIESHRGRGLREAGQAYLKRGEPGPAGEYFDRALRLDPRCVECRFYLAGPAAAAAEGFVDDLLTEPGQTAAGLGEWGRLYAEAGFYGPAQTCYRAARELDPEYFPAGIGLAGVLASDNQYEEAIELYGELADAFPGNSKILIELARVLAWSRRYGESIDLYDRVRELNPADPVPAMEKARVAFWAKDADLARETYAGLHTPAVDKKLVSALERLAEETASRDFREAFGRLRDQEEAGSIYRGYEEFAATWLRWAESLPPEEREKGEEILRKLRPEFEIQRAACLEREAKDLFWDKRFARARRAYRELVAVRPGNTEAVFDLAQTACVLGLSDESRQAYRHLLDIDPLHNLAGIALDRERTLRRVSLPARYSYWREDGRGGLEDIRRHRAALPVEVPLFSRYYLSLAGEWWLENPGFTGKSYPAYGWTARFGGVLSPFLRGDVGWTRKEYADDEFAAGNTGHAHLQVNLDDRLRLSAGYDRTDELYNYFGLEQGIQADTWWLAGESDLTRRLEVKGRAAYLNYSDRNEGERFILEGAYSLTDHPRILKAALIGEYRDTRHRDIFLYDVAGDLVDIVHPYWTPRDYTAGKIMLEWYHDLARFYFCGSELHFYDLKIIAGSDSENNASVQVEAEWYWEASRRWTFILKGLLHRSRKWDAEGAWASARYRF